MIGQTISHYKVLEQIGGGGMGVVYRAEDTSLQRQVALKFLPPDIVNDRQAVERFKREARAASALNHPNICTIHEIGEHDGQPFIVMELMKGKTLREKLLRGPLKTDEVLELGIQLADALDAAHSERIVHRDIKPTNIFVTERGQAKILDFGLAKTGHKSVGSESETETGSASDLDLTKAGSTVGTVSYMSPEQALGEKVDARTDLFSLGVVLYEAVTGRQPFTGTTSAAVFDQILHLAPTAPIQLNPDAPMALEQVINKALEKGPDLRCQSAAELRTDLKRLLRDTDSSRTVTVSAANIPVAKPQRSVGKPAFAVVGLLLVIALAYVLFPIGAGEQPLPRFSDLNPTFTPLTSQPGQELFPGLSPDGRSLVYTSRSSGNWDIYFRRVGGESVINLTEGSSAADVQPSFSPDGESIAFRSERDGGGIFMMGATGEAPRRLTDSGFHPVWSPDGSQVLFATQQVGRGGTGPRGRSAIDSELWTVDVSTGVTRQVFGGDAMQPHWSPGGHRIAYWASEGGQRDIWTIPAQGGDPVAITNDAAVDWNPLWSPDGNYLYFSSDRSGSMNLWRVPVDEETGVTLGEPEPVTTGASTDGMHLSLSRDGKRMAYTILEISFHIMKARFDPGTKVVIDEPVFVTEGSVGTTMPDVSPDGESLVFTRFPPPQEDLVISRSDGTDSRLLTDDAYFDRRPSWSPDGSKISFHSNRGGNFQIWMINADGSGLEQLTYEPFDVAQAFWSPDGLRLGYNDVGTGSFLIETDKAWEEQTPVKLPPMADADTFFRAWSWSPDGEWLAGFGTSATTATSEGIYVYSFASEQYEKLTASTGNGAPRWLNDNRTIVYQDGGRIYTVDRVTKDVNPIVSSPGFLERPVLSPDNRSIYYVARPPAEADIWLIELPDDPQ